MSTTSYEQYIFITFITPLCRVLQNHEHEVMRVPVPPVVPRHGRHLDQSEVSIVCCVDQSQPTLASTIGMV